ncbi:alpha-galactosidase [Clostridia bacterium]|nr:alpha-galactosidase [Clostridia bacterium]
MGITVSGGNRVFKLDTPNSSYIIAIVDDEGFVGHAYYGKRLQSAQTDDLLRVNEPPFVPSKNNRDRGSFLDTFPMEYPPHGLGDFRESCIVSNPISSVNYASHRIFKGKPAIPGLPATFGGADDCETLEIVCADNELEITLSYTAFEHLDAIARHVEITNNGGSPVQLDKVLSCCVDMENDDYDIITLHGSWARERAISRTPLGLGKKSVSSMRGGPGHQEHPFFALAQKSATQDAGDVYGFHFVYSGNFFAQAEVSQFNGVRAVMGINPQNFSWNLKPGESFYAPEVILTYSGEGLGKMTRTLHDLYREHLIRGQNKKRPILINNWEATYFDFNADKLLKIAADARKLGIEMFVLDDGWFGKRNDDNTSLGDWVVNEEKLPGGLPRIVSEINKTGMEFGLWFEPEAISPDSDLYRAHPDWAVALPGRVGTLCRNQYVLDLSRRDVLEHTYQSISNVLKSANITYVKWDMNRPLTDVGNGELSHRYVLGVYELQERLVTDFPHILLENCSGGGARFDPGMLYYGPQIWCSDDTDAIERLKIQEGTAMLYPLSSVGAHVSDCPNHAVGRVTPFETRGFVALAGTFGYELDVTKLSEADREMFPKQIEMFRKYSELVRTGDYYRIASYAENHEFDCWQVVSKDKTESLVTFIQVLGRPNVHSRRIRLKGLDGAKTYRIEIVGGEGEDARELPGDAILNAGINVQNCRGDFKGKLIYLEAPPQK